MHLKNNNLIEQNISDVVVKYKLALGGLVRDFKN